MKNFALYIIIATLILFTTLIYLNVDDEATSIVTDTTGEGTTVELWVQDSFSGSDSYFNDLIHSYESKNPSINFNLDIINGTDDQVYNYISEKILNGNTPDILLLSLNNYNSFATESKLHPLNLYLDTFEDDYFLPSVYANAEYQGSLYGLSYYLDPEIIVYNKSYTQDLGNFLDKPLTSTDIFLDHLQELNAYYQGRNQPVSPLSIPTLIKDGRYIGTLFGTHNMVDGSEANKSQVLATLYTASDQTHYDYNKLSAHNFFDGHIVYSIEPLSLIYKEIENDYNIKEAYGVVPVTSEALVKGTQHYAAIYHSSGNLDTSMDFLDLFFSEDEISKRYRFHSLPIICHSKRHLLTLDDRYNNINVWQYLENSTHFKLSPDAKASNTLIDDGYEAILYPSTKEEQGSQTYE